MIKKFESFKEEPEVKIKHYPNGQKWYEFWNLNNITHREDGPTYQYWYENGQKKNELWYLNGKLHRKDGPAVQTWFENGQKEREEWWLNSEKYTREEWINKLKRIGSIHYEEQKMLFDIEKYNL